jgi:general secretion pathway protein I
LKINKQQGFSLLEILIAFSILALSLGILLNIFSGGINTAMVAEDYTNAVQIAESLMAKVGSEIPIKDHQGSGNENKKYHWQLSISPFTMSKDNVDPKTLPAELFKVKVTVVWSEDVEGRSQRQIQIATLKLVAKSNAAS